MGEEIISNVIPEPHWYEDLKKLYEDGSNDVSNPEQLKELGYVKEPKSGGEYFLTPEGESALIEYQNRSLEQAKFNVTKIIGIFSGIIAGIASVGNHFFGAAAINFLVFVVAVVLVISAIAIEYAFKNAF